MQKTTITCKECGESLTLTSTDINYFTNKGLIPPKRCSICRNKRRDATRISDLSTLIGSYITRTKPSITGDRSFMGYKVLLVGVTPVGDILYQYPKDNFFYKEGNTEQLGKAFNDGYWKLVN